MDSLVFSGRSATNPLVVMMPGQVLQEKQQDEPPGVMNLIVTKGDSKTIPLTLSLNGYDPLNLTGAAIKFTVKQSPRDTQSDAVVAKSVGNGITVVNASGGQITIDFVPADTDTKEELLPMTFDIEVTLSGGSKYTLHRGVFTITNGTSS